MVGRLEGDREGTSARRKREDGGTWRTSGRITFRDGEKELPGGSRGHTPLSFSSVLLNERTCLCLGAQALLQSTLGRPLWCSSWSSPALVTVAAVSSHERTSWRKSHLSSCKPLLKRFKTERNRGPDIRAMTFVSWGLHFNQVRCR